MDSLHIEQASMLVVLGKRGVALRIGRGQCPSGKLKTLSQITNHPNSVRSKYTAVQVQVVNFMNFNYRYRTLFTSFNT